MILGFTIISYARYNARPRLGGNLEKSINKIWLKPRHDKIIKYRHSCKNEEGFWMSGYSNNNVHTSLVLIIVTLTLIAGPTITFLISTI
jgi:hypothetical protein